MAQMTGLVELSEQAAIGRDALAVLSVLLVEHGIRIQSHMGQWYVLVNDDRRIYPTFAHALLFALGEYEKAFSDGV